MTTETVTLSELMQAEGITVHSVFVPFSQSRNRDEETHSLNWRVTLQVGGMARREVLTTDYGAGIGHCESVDSTGNKLCGWLKISPEAMAQIKLECEDGKARQEMRGGNYRIKTRENTKPLPEPHVAGDSRPRETHFTMPDAADVLHSLLLDGSAIDAGGFEDWASDYGYDTDSRKAETMYRTCVDTGLALRAAFGESLLQELHESAQDM